MVVVGSGGDGANIMTVFRSAHDDRHGEEGTGGWSARGMELWGEGGRGRERRQKYNYIISLSFRNSWSYSSPILALTPPYYPSVLHYTTASTKE